MPTLATRTRNDLVNAALQTLGILAAGQDAAAEDFQMMDDLVDPLVNWLEDTDVVTLDDINEIPANIFNQMSILLADLAATGFGLTGAPASASNPQPVQSAINDIRLVTYGRPTYEPLKTEYF